ncbi:hypothetical protein AM588_10009093 [Phytophthora nicotianae]|uniref:Uncharacterized protein n=1 Tax=Phytophthora nicotianae TaxID=4792 RepID=A0A0W8DU50_PHYNI|nr:hypothetical protein AM588_10009093 [Phytophthora nicotianae]
MTKDEFRDWISKHYEDKLSLLKEEEQKLEEEARAKLGRVKGLQDCIVQAANKFGYYGVYEQPPHFQNAVDWIQNDCWVQDRWEPESPPSAPCCAVKRRSDCDLACKTEDAAHDEEDEEGWRLAWLHIPVHL